MKLLTSRHLDDHYDRWRVEPDFPSMHISGRFRTVERIFKLSSLAIPKFQAEALSDAYTERARHADILEQSDIDDWRKELAVELHETIPMAFSSMSVFYLTGAYEQSLRDLARYIGRRSQMSRAKQCKAEKRPQSALQEQLGSEAVAVGDVGAALQDLKTIRDALAHAGGYLFGEADMRRQELERIVQKDVGISLERNHLVPSERFLWGSLSATVQHLNTLTLLVCRAFPLSIDEP